jgi:hypothetical protein
MQEKFGIGKLIGADLKPFKNHAIGKNSTGFVLTVRKLYKY